MALSLLLLAQRAVRWAGVAQPRPCLPLPQVPPVAARRLGGAGVNTDPKPGSGGGGGGANRSAARPSFVLLWSTAAASYISPYILPISPLYLPYISPIPPLLWSTAAASFALALTLNLAI